MKLIVYKPSVDSSWPLALQLLFEDFSRFGRWLLPSLEELGLPIEVIETNDKVVERFNASGSEGETTLLVCVCFPHQIPLEVACRKIAVLPLMFDTYSQNAEYALPFEEWPKYLGLVDDVIVPTKVVEEKVFNQIGGRARVHLVEPRILSAKVSELVLDETDRQKKATFTCTTDMYLSTADGEWNSVYEPPVNVVNRFALRELAQPIARWSLGDPAQSGVWPIGFYPSDLWGAWAELKNSSVFLPVFVTGPIHLVIELQGSGQNIGREITLRFGNEVRQVVLTDYLEAVHFEFCPQVPTSQLHFEGYELDPHTDRRQLGVGLSSITMIRTTQWTGSTLSWSVSEKDTTQLSMIGFHLGDQWGSWAKTTDACVLLPVEVSGRVRLLINLTGCGENIGKSLTISVGEKCLSATLESDIKEHCFEFEVSTPVDRIRFDGFDIDHSVELRGLGFGIESIKICQLENSMNSNFEWLPREVRDADVDLLGFHPPETWGAWAKSKNAQILFPSRVSGRQLVSISLVASETNIGRLVKICLGTETREVRLPLKLEEFKFEFDVTEPTNSMKIEGYDIDRVSDGRGLGIGIGSIQVKKFDSVFKKILRKIIGNRKTTSPATFQAPKDLNENAARAELALSGKVFILLVRPSDLISNNWIEIIKDFALVYADNPNAQLIVVCPSSWMTTFLHPVSQFIDRLSSKVVLIHFVFLDAQSAEFAELCTGSNVILVKREDGLDFEIEAAVRSKINFVVGPSRQASPEEVSNGPSIAVTLLTQPVQLVPGMKSPVKVGYFYDNSSLCKGFEKASELSPLVSGDQHQMKELYFLDQQLKSIFVGTDHA